MNWPNLSIICPDIFFIFLLTSVSSMGKFPPSHKTNMSSLLQMAGLVMRFPAHAEGDGRGLFSLDRRWRMETEFIPPENGPRQGTWAVRVRG